MAAAMTIQSARDLRLPEDVARVVDFLRPKPSPFPLSRIGGSADGAYLVPECLDGVVACFSPGTANRKDFEDELLERYGIRSHMMDFSSDVEKFMTPLIEGQQTFEKLWLDPKREENSMSLEDWVHAKEPSEGADLILQMDIEGAEYANLLSTSRETLNRFRVMVVELHGLHGLLVSEGLADVMVPLVEHLDSLFVVIHAHPNNCCPAPRFPGSRIRIPQVLEITMVRRTEFEECDESERFAPVIPHPQDLAKNVADNPHVELGFGWSDTPRTAALISQEFRAWRFDIHRIGLLKSSVDFFYRRLPGKVQTLLSRLRIGSVS